MTAPVVGKRIDLGSGHTMEPIVWPGEAEETPIGYSIYHTNPDTGLLCGCTVWIDPERVASTIWQVVQASPLTLSPSIQCGNCRDHGYVREGRWVSA